MDGKNPSKAMLKIVLDGIPAAARRFSPGESDKAAQRAVKTTSSAAARIEISIPASRARSSV